MVNLERDVDRKIKTGLRLKKVGLNPIVHHGLDCLDSSFNFSKYNNLATEFWGDKDNFKPGAFGCYLSHANYWRLLLKSNKQFAFIIEDDVIPNENAFKCLDLSSLPNGFDLISLNQAPYSWLEAIKKTCNNEEKYGIKKENGNYYILSDVLIRMIDLKLFKDKIPAMGAYGYLISRAGAKKLLDALENQKICMGVDYAMLFNSLSNKQIQELLNMQNLVAFDKLAYFINNVYKNDVSLKLNSYVYGCNYLVSIDWEFPTSLNHNHFISNKVFN